jgi:hypothetical protein
MHVHTPAGQPRSEPRAWLTPLQERLFDLIRRAGIDGISGADLFAILYDGRLPRYQGGHAGRGETRQPSTIKANVWLLNRALAGSGHSIRRRDRAYRLE